jgi:ketosteroid isomerase-like protein
MHRYIAVPLPRDVAPPVVAAPSTSAPARGIDARLAGQQVTQRMKDYTAIIRTGDVNGGMAFWADDATFFEMDLQLVGKPAITQLATDVLGANRITSLVVNTDEYFAHDQGSTVYQFGNYEETIEPKDGKTPATTLHNNFVARWRRGADNVWRIDRFLATPQPKAAAEHAGH